jgi:hypothetical protein
MSFMLWAEPVPAPGTTVNHPTSPVVQISPKGLEYAKFLALLLNEHSPSGQS